MSKDEVVNELYNLFYENGMLKTFEKTNYNYTKENFYQSLVLAYGDLADFAFDLFIGDAKKSGYIAS